LELAELLEARRQKLLEKADVVSALADPVPRSVLLGELLRSQPDGVALTSVELNGRRVKPPSHQDEKKSPTVKPAGQEPPRRVPPPRFEHEVVVNGEASDNTGVADLLRSIGESPLFGEVNLEFIADAQRDGLDLRGFRVTMKLRAEADGADALRLRLVGAPWGAERFGEGER
ncbi:MAG: PilN domain-containing protein, partial [Planctomycetota bacterium]